MLPAFMVRTVWSWPPDNVKLFCKHNMVSGYVHVNFDSYWYIKIYYIYEYRSKVKTAFYNQELVRNTLSETSTYHKLQY